MNVRMVASMSLKLIIGFVIVSAGLMLGMAFLISAGSNKVSGVASATSPKATISETRIDVGQMKVADEKMSDFTIKNEGKEPLKISGMNSSCGCTVGQFVYQGKTSAEYGMHAQSGYLGAIAPGEEAVVRVTYRPSQMPVYGAVERMVTVETNDPQSPKLTLTVAARVE